jgi:hypothetical protein
MVRKAPKLDVRWPRTSRRRRIALLAAVAVVGAAVGAAAFPGSASAYSSFYVYASANVWSYSNTLDVTTRASYTDFSCSPSYACDKNVLVEVVLHRGYSKYSPIVGRQYGQTGQYGSSVRSSFRLPNCRYIPRFRSQPYTVEINAVAPDGTERSTTRMVTQYSCAR